MTAAAAVYINVDEKKLDSILAEVDRCHAPGAAVGVAVGGRPVYRKGFGLASMELPVVLSPQTRMRIYSITKHFTCLAYLLLCEEGKCALDDPIGMYLPEMHPLSARATIRQLMTNTSGLRDVCDIRWNLCGAEGFLPVAEVLTWYRGLDDFNFQPGAAWCYNNGGFHLIAAAVERISGQQFVEVLRSRIFEPAGMNDTLLRRADTDFVPNSASMHMTSSAGGFNRSYLPGELGGEGGIVSTVDDMLGWLAQMESPVVGSRQTWALMKTPQRLDSGALTGYGLGLLIGDHLGLQTIGHSGGGQGANAQMITVPGASLDLIVIVNRMDLSASEIAANLLDACLGQCNRAKPAASVFAEGTFRSPESGHVIQLYQEHGRQLMSLNGAGMGFPLEEDQNGVLRSAPAYGSFRYAIRLSGDRRRPAAIEFDDFGRTDELEALPLPASVQEGRIAGDYISPTTGIRLRISGTGEQLTLESAGRFGSATYRVICLADGVWQFKSTAPCVPWGGIISLDPSEQALSLSTARTWGLRFTRRT
jgi:D-aminopeptidase